jgi:hypothetical protein
MVLAERENKFDLMQFWASCILVTIIMIMSSVIVVLVIVMPIQIVCKNSSIFTYEGSTFECINDKCRVYNMTYVSYTKAWSDCSDTVSEYLEPNKLNNTLSKIQRTNNIKCYYHPLIGCNTVTYVDYSLWFMITLFSVIILGILLIVCASISAYCFMVRRK